MRECNVLDVTVLGDVYVRGGALARNWGSADQGAGYFSYAHWPAPEVAITVYLENHIAGGVASVSVADASLVGKAP